MRVPGARSLWRQFLLAGGCVATCIVHDASAIHERGLHFLAQSGSTHQLTDNTAPPSLFALSNYARGRQIDDVGQAAGGSGVTDVDPESSAKPQHAYIGAGSCESNPCGEDADCTENSLGHACTCHLGFFWDGQLCISIREHHMCAPGQPVDLNVRNEYECECIPGYVVGTGTAPNGAAVETCVVETCPDGYYRDGDSCKLPTNDLCEPGRLGPQTNPNEYTCKCPATHFVETFVGDGNINLQRCTPDPCYGQCSSGTCTRSTSEESGFTCECPEHYSVVTVGDKQVCQAGPCAENPCGDPEIGHTCRATSDTEYTCSCAPGYVFNGVTCAESSANPCYPGTVATTDGLGGYTCNCTAGYMAEDIEDSGDVTQQRCIEDVCYNKCDNGTCSRTPRLGSDSAYRCECHEGYDVKRNDQGEYCEAIGCSSNPCGPPEEGHQCSVSGDNGYACTCASKYFFNGTECEKATNALCSPGRLGAQANTNEYTCKCPATHFVETFVGDGNVNLQRCTPDPCYGQCSSGTCTRSTSEESGFTCECPEHYSVVTVGDKQVCQAGPCAENPCGDPEIGHTCRATSDTEYTCSCAPGYVFNGVTCAESSANPCYPGTVATTDGLGGYTCNCTAGYMAEDIEDSGDVTQQRCIEDVCYNKCDNGTCSRTPRLGSDSAYRCECHEGYDVKRNDQGEYCEAIGCSSNPCGPPEEGHQCSVSGDNGYACTCASKYFFNGTECEKATNALCSPGRLGAQANTNEYTCKCPATHFVETFVGDGNVNLQRCTPDPCYGQCSSGTCTRSTSEESGFTCECPEHYSVVTVGDKQVCQAGPCAENPCGDPEIGHTCRATSDTEYTCSCAPGYVFNGVTCAESSANPCYPGTVATTDELGGYTCNCTAGYMAENIEDSGDVTQQRCIEDVCYNKCDNGTCSRTPRLGSDSAYRCECHEGYDVKRNDQGEYCEAIGCSSNPCGPPEEGHQCSVSGDNGYACTCASKYFFNGTECEKATNALCSPGRLGTQANTNEYTCKCPATHFVETFVGDGNVNLQRCTPDPCYGQCSSGTCTRSTSEESGFTCECPEHYSVVTVGDKQVCQAGPCAENPCGDPEIGHTCRATSDTEYTCSCAPGYVFNGVTCAESSANPCYPGTVATTDGLGGYTCNCTAGYMAEDIEDSGDVTQQRCIEDVCYNKCDNGTCSRTPRLGSDSAYRCECHEGYDVKRNDQGEYCEAIGCSSNPCGPPEEGHQCSVSGDNGYACTCASKYFFNGTECEKATNALCSPGRLGAQANTNEYTCKCPATHFVETFVGDGNVNLQRCTPDPCYGQCSSGTCTRSTSEESGFTCECPEHYSVVTVGDKQVCKAVSCAQNPCGNPEMHTCTRFGDTDYMCFCAAGYYFDGFTCKVLTGDLCWPGELGTQETRNSYTCSCPDGYNRDKYLSDGGVTLERCLEDVCYNKCDNGNCIEVNGETRTYRCQCNEGYSPDQSGKNCVRDQCSTSPCGPSSLGHQCTNEEDGTYSCICANGYYLNGNTCEMAINLRCFPGVLGTQLRPNEYTCNCTPPYIAQDFEAAGGVTLQKCVRDPCSGQCAHGTCTQSSETSWGYTCNCDTHYTLEETEHGQYCRGDPCASSPCGNEDDGHQCTSPDESTYSCQCSQGFYFDGGKCQRVSEDLCEHGSLGTLTANQYTCNCDEGYVAQDFDVAENVTLQRCIADVCYRQCDHGECRVDDSRDGGYACTCSEGYSVASTPEGEFCQEDPCSLNPCGWPDRADSCENTAESSYACTCAAGYYYDGQTCQEATDDLCTPGWLGEQTHVNAYTCTCPSGTVVEDFEGAGQVTLQKCVADTCLHDRCSPGSCTPNHSAPFGYECTCGPGLSLEMTQDGPMCAHDPCSLSPCGSPEANHICVNLVGEEYACTCASGYYLNGNSCAPLSDSLCAPGNVQQDDVNTYTCVCPDSHQLQEFTGPAGLPVQRCVADICGDQCDPGSCSHDKTKNGWYTCTCLPGFLSQPGAPVTGGEKCVPDECPLEDCGLENVKYCLRVNGAPQCFCNDGYYYNKFTAQCTLENPCDYDVCGASEAVENCNFLGGGKWTCECRPGFRVETSARDEQSCVRASFCDGDPCGPPDVNRCVSTLKGYSCRCGAGYTLVRKPQMTCEPVS